MTIEEFAKIWLEHMATGRELQCLDEKHTTKWIRSGFDSDKGPDLSHASRWLREGVTYRLKPEPEPQPWDIDDIIAHKSEWYWKKGDSSLFQIDRIYCDDNTALIYVYDGSYTVENFIKYHTRENKKPMTKEAQS